MFIKPESCGVYLEKEEGMKLLIAGLFYSAPKIC